MTKKITVIDPITGRAYVSKPETRNDIISAIISVVYLLIMLLVLSWMLADICIGKASLLTSLTGKTDVLANAGLLRLVLYAVFGGGLGGTLNGIRSLLFWHAEKQMFGWRYLWKYLSAPLVGGVLAAIAYALVRGGVVAFAGDVGGNTEGAVQGLAAFGIGALAGYGSHSVFQWLDAVVKRVFKVPETDVTVPDLFGMTKEEAQTTLLEFGLLLGQIARKKTTEPDKAEKVIAQDPAAEEKVPRVTSVDITLGELEQS